MGANVSLNQKPNDFFKIKQDLKKHTDFLLYAKSQSRKAQTDYVITYQYCTWW